MSTHRRTGEAIISTSFGFNRRRRRQPNQFCRTFGRIDKRVVLCPAIGVCEINRNLLAKLSGIIVYIRIHSRTEPDCLHYVKNGKVSSKTTNTTMQCCLPKAIRSLCRTGCIYREANFKHLKCPQAKKTDLCAGPCEKPCPCTPKQVIKIDASMRKKFDLE